MLESLIERFADAGLAILIMGIIIYFLYKNYVKVVKSRDRLQQEHVAYVKDMQEKQLETMNKFSNALDNLVATLTK